MSSIYGHNLKLAIFGESHGSAIGMTLDCIPAGLPVNAEQLQKFLNRRAPGRYEYSTARKEEDVPQFLSGLLNGYTSGSPITAIIYNHNCNSSDYAEIKNIPRPGHADYSAYVKYNDYQDTSGGGHLSGRLTAPLCIAGGLCKQWLESRGITIAARISSIGHITDNPFYADWVNPDLSYIEKEFPVYDDEVSQQMKAFICEAKTNGDSVGGTIECIATGLDAGLGDPIFGNMESRIAQAIYSIPGIKAISFGSGFTGCSMKGSENNDPFMVQDGRIATVTNHAGGILGGISTGMPLVFHVGVKPTPSIAQVQQSVSLNTLCKTDLAIQGRHDPCIVPRVIPVVEAAAALAIWDCMLANIIPRGR